MGIGHGLEPEDLIKAHASPLFVQLRALGDFVVKFSIAVSLAFPP